MERNSDKGKYILMLILFIFIVLPFFLNPINLNELGLDNFK